MNEPADIDQTKEEAWLGPIGQFAVKTCIVAVVLSFSTVVVVDSIIGRVESAIADGIRGAQATTIGGPAFWSKIERELANAADPRTDLPPEQRERLLNNLRSVVVRWKPFADVVATELQKPPAAN